MSDCFASVGDLYTNPESIICLVSTYGARISYFLSIRARCTKTL